MANDKNTTGSSNAKQSKPKKGIGGLISAMIATLFFSLMLSIIIECVYISFFWEGDITHADKHSEMMLNTEFGYLSQDFVDSLVLSEPVQYTEELVKSTYDLIAVKSGLINTLNEQVNDKTGAISLIIKSIGVYLKAMVNIILLFLVRVMILVLSTPIFILALIVGVVDGLVRRDIRRFGSGRESSFIYYHAKAWIKPMLIFAWLIYLSMPFSIHPNAVFIPMAFLFGLSVSITFGSFKKYLYLFEDEQV